MRELAAGAGGRFAQGGLRPRPGRSPDRSAAPAPRTWPRSARCAPAPASSRSRRRDRASPIVAAMAPEYMTRAARGNRRRARSTSPPPTASWTFKADVIALGPGLGQDPSTVRLRPRASSSARALPLVLDADALNAFAGDPERLTGRDGVDVIITPHPGEMARLLNVNDRAGAVGSARARPRVRVVAPRPRRPEGPPHGHRRTRGPLVREPDRQRRHGDRRHRRPAHRHDRRVVRADPRRGRRRASSPSTCTARPAISRTPTKGKSR